MASGKPQNLLVPLIMFVVLTVASSVTAFLYYQQTTKMTSERDQAKGEKTKADQAKAVADQQIKTLKLRIGYDLEFGTENDPPGGNTLMAKIAEELSNVEVGATPTFKDPKDNTLKDELARLRQKRDDISKELLTKTDDHNQLRADFEKIRVVEATNINENVQKREAAESTLASEQAEKARSLAANEQQRQDLMKQASVIKLEKNQTERDLNLERDRNQKVENSLTIQVTDLKESVSRVQSAGKPVGSVVSVDYLNRQVYIDRGEGDRLPPQTTFSIWSPDKKGTLHWKEKNEKVKKDAIREYDESGKRTNLAPRLEGGPKGYIEVISILANHQSVAKITMDNILDPITPGDLLYSPIWSPGQQKHFALVGKFDLTGKGTNDRALLIDMIKRQGGVIDAEVRDDGTLDGDVEVGTNYLVIGDIAEAGDGSDPSAQYAPRILASATDLKSKAKRLAVDTIDQRKLYDFMGYTPRSHKYDMGSYTGAPQAGNRFENPSSSTRPKGIPSFESGASSRPTGITGKSSPKK